MFGKLFASMFEGSLHGHWKAIVTLEQMVILADLNGTLDMTPHALAARTSIPLEIIQEGIELLEKPDEYSRSAVDQGRRIVRLDDSRPWGWRIVNYKYYRDLASAEEKRAADRARIAEKRRHFATLRDMSQNVAKVAHTEVEADAEAEASESLGAAAKPKKKKKWSRRVPGDFSPDRDLATKELPDLDVDREIQKFRDCEFRRARSDWPAVWRTWIGNCKDSGRYARKATVGKLNPKEWI